MYEKEWNELTDEQKLFYFGGLIDGEGHIGCQYYGERKRPVIQLQMTCKDTVQRFADFYGLVVRELKSPSRIENKKWKPLFQARSECQKALPILKSLENYVFLKRPALKEALKYYVGRLCLICSKEISHDLNARTKYCCAACRQKAKRIK